MPTYGEGIYGSGLYGGESATAGDVTIVTAPGISVAASTVARPPRFEITITATGGQPMTAVTLNRTSGGVTTGTRVQPPTGFSTQYVEDYEAPWGADVVYAATVTTTSGTTTYTAPPVALHPWGAWLIHPIAPTLSVCVDSPGAALGAAVMGVDAISRASTVTRHQVLGSPRPVVTRAGNRASSEGKMTVATLSAELEDKLWAVLDDQTPVMIQFPTEWGTNWEAGYYDIGDVDAARYGILRNEPARIFTLPFVRVDSPAGTQQARWSYAQLDAAFPDYPSMIAAYSDYGSLLTNRQTV
jgi:hypothetical protein